MVLALSVLRRRTGSGVCVPPEDPAAMAAEIARLADAPAEMQRLRRQAHAAAPQFSRDALAQDLLRVLEAVARRR